MPVRPLSSYHIRDIMSKDPVTAAPEDKLSDVLGKMREHDIHDLPVVSRRNVLGLVSLNTLIRRRNLPLTTKVGNLLVRAPEVRPNDDLPTVAEILMSSGYRTVPVMEDSRLVGIVSRTDVVKVLPQVEGIKDVTVEGIMSPNTQTVKEEDTLPQARKILLSLDERAIPVVDGEDRLVGVVGLKDFTEYLWKPKERATTGEQRGEKIPLNLEVKSIMRRPPLTVGERATVAEAAALMDRHRISIVIVARDGRILGIVSQADLMELVASFRGRDQLYVQISGLDEDEAWAYEGLYDIIQKGIRRVSDIVTPSILNVHVARHEETPSRTVEARSKYSLRARMTCASGMYYAWEHDWDLFKAMDRVMEQFERRIKKEKEMRLQGRRAAQERRTPPRAS